MNKEYGLIRKVKNGNHKAYKKLFDANFVPLYRYLKQFSKNEDLVQDWTQRAFIKAFYNIGQFNMESRFSTWLFKIAINEMRSDFRSKSYKNTISLEEDRPEEPYEQENDFEWNQDMKWLIGDLDEIKKSVFILYEVEGYKHSEISEILNISEAQCRTALCRAKKLLREKWLQQEVING